MQGHAERVGQLDPFDGIHVNGAVPVGHLLGRQLGQQREVSRHHQTLNVMRIAQRKRLFEGIAHTGHAGLAAPEPAR